MPSAAVDLSRALVGKAGRTYFVTAADGGVPRGGDHPLGVFRDDARHLSTHELRVAGERPALVDSGEEPDGRSWARLHAGGRVVRLAREAVRDGCVEERWSVEAPAASGPVDVELTLDADFEPMLVLRGAAPPLPPVDVRARAEPDGLLLHGRGRDGVRRSTRVRARPSPSAVDGRVLRFRLAPGAELCLRLSLDEDGASDGDAEPAATAPTVRLRSDDAALEAVARRAFADLATLRTSMDGRVFPAAGVPWYVALFGRDALITALQALPFLPDLADGTLRLLAARVGSRTDRAREEEPGKVLHELRAGELARLDQAPLARYYGSVDATPLFLLGVAEHARWSGATEVPADLGPAVDAALGWLGDRPLTYAASAAGGLRHQGWKDSDDGVPDERGEQPRDPIALVEAQGYAVAALRGLAGITGGHRAGDLRRRADAFAGRLEGFWLGDRRCYAMALGGDGAPTRSVGSNQGHLLWARAVAPARAAAIRDALLGPSMWTGWGVRTLACDEPAYDPVAYHRGSVWPHDTALFAAGLRAYGFDDAFRQVSGGLFDAAAALPDARLPELFAGTPRHAGDPPAAYPAACRPQAWAAGAVAMLLATALGLDADGAARRLVLRRPLLPGRSRELEVDGLRVAGARVDVRLRAAPDGATRVETRVDGELAVDVVQRH